MPTVTLVLYKATRCASDLWPSRGAHEPLWQLQVAEGRVPASALRRRFEKFLRHAASEIPKTTAELEAIGVRLVAGTDGRCVFYLSGFLSNFMCMIDEWLRYEEAQGAVSRAFHMHPHTSIDVDTYKDVEPWRYVFHAPTQTPPLSYHGAPPIFGSRAAALTITAKDAQHFTLVLSGDRLTLGRSFWKRLENFGFGRLSLPEVAWGGELMDAANPAVQGRVFDLLETVLNNLALEVRVSGEIGQGALHALLASLRELRSLHFVDVDEEVVKKRPGEQESDASCHICASRGTDSAFIPCGHVLACFRCAAPLLRCPLCRRPSKAYRIYHA